MKMQLRLLAALLLAAAAPSIALAKSPPPALPAPALPACDDSLKAAFKPDDLTSVIAVKLFKSGDPLVMTEPEQRPIKALNELCLVKLVVGPGNPGPAGAPSTSPGIGIEVWLPARAAWNKRIHTIGGLGGFDGGEHANPARIGWPYAALTAGGEGAVSASTDSGHRLIDGSWGMNPDGTIARQLWTDFAHRAQHEMALKVKALTLLYYGRPQKFAYYEGASTGGRHGYRLAQQYPGDYDGIIGVLPAISWNGWVTSAAFGRLVDQRDLGGVALTESQQDLASNAAIRACDVVGGVHLGYIMDNPACIYDPSTDRSVLCRRDGGANRTADCLGKAQAMALNKKWYGITSDGSVPSPALDNGVASKLEGKHRWYGFVRGTSLYNAYYSKLDPFYSKLLREASQGGSGREADWIALILQNPTLAGPTFKNASGDGQALWRELSYAQLNNAFDRGAALEPVFGNLASDNSDLSGLQARGTKFLSWHGWNDEAIPVQGTIRYYDRVVETMGGLDKVQDFFRLYLVPGAGHLSPQGTSNPAANPPVVPPGMFYQMMTDWVEKGIAPGREEIASRLDKPVRITQPICPYPQEAVYTSGDPHVAASYTCASRK